MAWFVKKLKKVSEESVPQKTADTASIDNPVDNETIQQYEQEYSETSFWGKICQLANNGKEDLIREALKLYYITGHCDASQKTKIFCALGYLILPFDVCADIIPMLGFVDDLAAFSFVFSSIESVYKDYKEEIDAKVTNKMTELKI